MRFSTELNTIYITSLAVGGGYMVDMVLPIASVELLWSTAELSLNKVNTASVSSLSLRPLSAKHFPIRL